VAVAGCAAARSPKREVLVEEKALARQRFHRGTGAIVDGHPRSSQTLGLCGEGLGRTALGSVVLRGDARNLEIHDQTVFPGGLGAGASGLRDSHR
jgi:hypothetical protein